ncbi:MAG: DUF2961 domain-containing protein [Planctomycetes bacterium]|nr:DUF2961 domain-containing protein [Planctomycetota bacterium]
MMEYRLLLKFPSALKGPLTAKALTSLALLFGALSVVGTVAAQDSARFYKVFPSRVRTLVKASYDPDDRETAANQGNDDGFSGINHSEAYSYSENGTPVSVLAHFEGQQGVLGLFFRNFWRDCYGLAYLPGENNRTRMWVDGAVAHDMPLEDYFRNPGARIRQVPPFDGPFTRSRSGGHLTHAQIRWQDSFKLALDDDAYTNSARFHRVAATLASPEGELPLPDKAEWERIANHPGAWPHRLPRVPVITTLNVGANNGRDGVILHGPSTVLELTFEVRHPSDWVDLWARFTWDNAARPQVEVPLRHLGGMPEPPASFPVHSLLLDNDGSNRITCWFPMPFAEIANVEIENRGAQPISVRVTHCSVDGEPEAGWGYFTAMFRREITGTGEPFQGPRLTDCHGMLRCLILEDFADNSGRIPDMHMTHLEGDLCIRTNGDRGDEHTFAASETGIGRWGWYITPADRPFVSDTSFQSSLMARVLPNRATEGRRIMGSTYLFDPVHFVDGIDIVLEHGVQNTSNADYSLSAFLYVQPGAARRAIAEIDIGNTSPNDPRGEPLNRVRYTEWGSYVRSGNFLRDQFYGTPAVTEHVRQIRDYLTFRVQRRDDADLQDPCAVGFRLDRLGGAGLGLCQADVFVDGQPAGLLHVFTHNEVFPWKEGGECEVNLPFELTKGKSSFMVELRPRVGSDPVNVARVWVYEYLK